MTRETKAGVIVSCSFLCLVGVVLYTKLKEHLSTPAADTALAQTDPTLVPPDPTPNGQEMLVAQGPVPLPGAPHLQPAPQPPEFQLVSAANPNPEVKPPPMPSMDNPPGHAVPAIPPPPEANSQAQGIPPVPPPPSVPENKPHVPDPVKPVEPAKPETPAQTGFELPPPNSTPAAAPASAPTANSGFELPPPPGSSSTPASIPPVPSAPAQPTTPSANTPGLPDLSPPSPPTPTATTSIPPPPVNDTPAPVVATPPAPTLPASTPPPPTLPPASRELTSMPNRPEIQPPPDRTIQLGAPGTALPPPNQLAQRPGPAAPPPPDRPPNRPMPPLNSPINPPTPPSPAPTAAPPANVPQVDSYDEETYHCRANDSFRTISMQFYRSEKYSQALWLFNRNHPLASDMVRQDPPILQAGQPIYIPPIRILEKYYSSTIPETPVAPGNPSPRPASPLSGATIDRTYKVSGNGEAFLEVAHRTLGSGDRWTEIYRLNPRFDPKQPIPAGSVLRLPADARVERDNLP